MITLKQDGLYLITGGTGFLGEQLVKQLISQNIKVRVLARDEGKLIALKEQYPSIEIYTGDVSDYFEVKQAMDSVTGVFHLAASKHVGLAEKFVRENVKSNTIGSLNILENSIDHPTLEFIISTSTDKAAQVSGVYGATKLLMERLFYQYESINPKCKYRIVRYGNVLYSTGSVLCKWRDCITEGRGVTVTALEATRFFWTVDEAVELIFDCLRLAVDASPYCPTMKSMSINNLLQAVIEKYSNGQTIDVKVIGLQPGENLHEKVLVEGPYSDQVDQYTVEEIKNLI